ncbi:MAG TPA: D-alanyl-D-alanine carboxypeptidase [Streptosporangiaceae bacterium]|nr:D-alanyl-D-alanine carboxypeptidase [Streptosporangiaceae bacterium]
MLKQARQAAVVLLAAGFLAAGLPASGLPATSALAAAAAGARAIGARPAATGHVTAGPVGHVTAGPAALAPASPPANIYARGAELMNAVTGQRLWSRHRNRRRPMGSIAKVMTALLVIRAGHLGRLIKITKAIPAYIRRHPDASNAGLRAGDVLTARQLLEGMLLPSGCDAALALAKAYGPGRKAFVREMNATAQQLGMLRTHFSNFDGLPLPTEHSTYSTPRNLITLGRAAMKLAPFRRIVDLQSHTIAATSAHHGYSWQNTNLLLGAYPGAIGIKTGSTNAAGYCLLFEATSGATTLIGVVLHSTDTNPMARFTAATRLLNWGFGASVAPPRRPAGPVRD